LINEVYDVVEKNFDDARGTGFNAARWRSVRDAALSRPLKDAAASHSAVREMLATLKDPYSRFLTPEEFGAMAKYDVSGVGLNLGTWEDLKSKTDLLSQRSDSTENNFGTGKSDTGGVWVVGIIRNSSAATAGMCQGDEILELDGAPLDHKSPFQIASMLQGKQEEEADAGAPRKDPRHLRDRVDDQHAPLRRTRRKWRPSSPKRRTLLTLALVRSSSWACEPNTTSWR